MMDIEMFEMNGFDVVEVIMEECLMFVFMFLVYVEEDVDVMFEVFDWGVVDFVMKLGGEVIFEMFCVKWELVEKI